MRSSIFIVLCLCFVGLMLQASADQPQPIELPPQSYTLPSDVADVVRPLLVTPAVHPADNKDADRIADLERRVAALERKCKCSPEPLSYTTPYTIPQPAEKSSGSVCDANGCRIVSGSQSSSGGNCSSGSCGPAAGFRPFGGLFRRR